MSQENVEIVRAVYERFSEGDFRASADVLDPHVVLPKVDDPLDALGDCRKTTASAVPEPFVLQCEGLEAEVLDVGAVDRVGGDIRRPYLGGPGYSTRVYGTVPRFRSYSRSPAASRASAWLW